MKNQKRLGATRKGKHQMSENGIKTNEPTTVEIVRALRCVAEATECKDCRYKYPVGNVILCDHEQMNGNAADRLESQEQKMERLTKQNKELVETVLRKIGVSYSKIVEGRVTFCGLTMDEAVDRIMQFPSLTARAEQDERERDAAIADIERMRKEKIPLCPICDFNDMIRCCHDSHCDGYQLFRWRGLPQEGEGE